MAWPGPGYARAVSVHAMDMQCVTVYGVPPSFHPNHERRPMLERMHVFMEGTIGILKSIVLAAGTKIVAAPIATNINDITFSTGTAVVTFDSVLRNV